MFLPSTITFPEVDVSIPPKILRAVVFPAPEAPKITANSPFSIEKFAQFRALILFSSEPYSFTTLLNSI